MGEPHDIQAVRDGVRHQVRVTKEKNGWSVAAYPSDNSRPLFHVGWLLLEHDGYLLERDRLDDLRGEDWDALIREAL